MLQCLHCGKELTGNQTKYCSQRCQLDYQQEQYINRWKQGLENGLSGKCGLSKRIKHYLLDKTNYKCEKCGWGEINKYTNTIPLEIHHKDGKHSNNIEENLQVLCPNCHSLTSNYKAANKNSTRVLRNKEEEEKKEEKKKLLCKECGVEITKDSKSGLCQFCVRKASRICERPSREQLKKLIRNTAFTTIGEQYGVSDNAVRKWCKVDNLPSRKVDINKYSDEDWDKI